ncbi:MAG: hypothetical protein LBB13_00025, partial [Rickettsiales bacterium]|nr:hypothetical protein [Rickettsiales bacterium]
MKILEKNKNNVRWVSFVLSCCLTAMSAFCVIATGRAIALEVYNFVELKRAIDDNGKNYINVKQDITFNDAIIIERGNLTISGPGGGGKVKLNGSGQDRFFTVKKGWENISLNNLHFDGGYDDRPSLINNELFNPEAGGGAVYFEEGVKIVLENTTFSNNQTKLWGGAIRSQGTEEKRNTLEFKGETVFSGNKIEDHDVYGGGAIYGEFSNITFNGEVIFEKNKLLYGSGGAIYGYFVALTFGKKATFDGNESFGTDGGAINAEDNSSLTFEGLAIFKDNRSASEGGAIYANRHSSLTFGGLATFENNRSKNIGGAIYVSDGVSIEFRDSLNLVGNIIERADSGALHMWGNPSNKLVTITLVQRNPSVPTEFKGNKSGENGRNAVYMTQCSRLNFFVEKGNVNIYDVFSGYIGRPGDIHYVNGHDNIITINRGEGWINIEKGGFIENVKVVNRGNLKLAGESDGFNLIDFTNSGTIRFEILPGGRSAKIRAN